MNDEVEARKLDFLDTKVLLGYISPDTLKRILKETTTVKYSRKHGKTEKINNEAFAVALGREAVKGWENITLKSEPFPYTPENCDILMAGWVEFSAFVIDACSDMANFQEEVREEDVKKS